MGTKPVFEPIASRDQALMCAKESARLSRFWRRTRINTGAHRSESLSLVLVQPIARKKARVTTRRQADGPVEKSTEKPQTGVGQCRIEEVASLRFSFEFHGPRGGYLESSRGKFAQDRSEWIQLAARARPAPRAPIFCIMRLPIFAARTQPTGRRSSLL